VKPVHSLYLYRGGEWTPAAPADLGMPGEYYEDDALGKAGYTPSQTVGDESGLHFQLFERSTKGAVGCTGWLVSFSTAGYFCDIVVESWPDLVTLLRDLSAITLAGLITDDDVEGRCAHAHLPVAPVRTWQRAPRRRP
jgi:hypothetical protein